jgi:hypothetical protein
MNSKKVFDFDQGSSEELAKMLTKLAKTKRNVRIEACMPFDKTYEEMDIIYSYEEDECWKNI